MNISPLAKCLIVWICVFLTMFTQCLNWHHHRAECIGPCGYYYMFTRSALSSYSITIFIIPNTKRLPTGSGFVRRVTQLNLKLTHWNFVHTDINLYSSDFLNFISIPVQIVELYNTAGYVELDAYLSRCLSLFLYVARLIKDFRFWFIEQHFWVVSKIPSGRSSRWE